MKRSLKDLINYSIEAKDGTKGRVKDLLFDEETWMIRYLQADLGFILPGKKVLIPRNLLESPEWINYSFPVNLTKETLENCPKSEEKEPVSRKYEKQLNQYYKIKDYWTHPPVYPIDNQPIMTPGNYIKIPTANIEEKDIDTNLRSFKEVRGYHVKSTDGELSHIADLIVDERDWQIKYMVIDTSSWLPWSKQYLISIHYMEEISYVNQEIKINLSTKLIKAAPEFDPSEPVNEVYEKRLYDFYGKPVME